MGRLKFAPRTALTLNRLMEGWTAHAMTNLARLDSAGLPTNGGIAYLGRPNL